MFQRKRYHYAEGDMASVNSSLADLTAKLNDAQAKYSEAIAAIAACNNSSIGCLDETGRHISSWRADRDQYSKLITEYKSQISDLLSIQKSLASASVNTSQAISTASAAQQAVASAQEVTTKANAKKWLLYGGIGAGVLVAGIFAVKMFRKKS
jgi:hypothetical protein